MEFFPFLLLNRNHGNSQRPKYIQPQFPSEQQSPMMPRLIEYTPFKNQNASLNTNQTVNT